MNRASFSKASLLFEFIIPVIILLGIFLYLLASVLKISSIATLIILVVIFLGSYRMLIDTTKSLLKGQFALDYIAILAIFIALLTHEYLVGAILALMLSTGETLEDYGSKQARKTLTQLIDRIPTDVITWENGKTDKKEKLESIQVGQRIFVRKGEVIGLDGVLESSTGETDESSLTGEPYYITKQKGDLIRSGTINIGDAIVVRVTHVAGDSTYKKIIDMVKQAEEEKSPMVRLANKYSTIFTLITFCIAVVAYWISNFDLSRVLAVLAVATPCPLIIATPIALLGGMNASAKRKIIIKKLASLEVLSRVNSIVFDKTGTITLGKPHVTHIEIHDKKWDESEVLAIGQAIERNSLHPLAKAIIEKAVSKNVKNYHAENVSEIIGKGIEGVVSKKKYLLAKKDTNEGMAIAVFYNNKVIATFYFEDRVKDDSKKVIKELQNTGLELQIYTGDKKVAAQKILEQVGENIAIKAECTPQEKRDGIAALKKEGKITAMVGDGINDAPALALADVGMAYSNQEQTAASEAADIVFLGGDFSMVLQSWKIAKRTVSIARESILWGIGLSVGAMVLASVGLIPPLFGAGLQELIDVAVIFNALRASR